MNIYFDTETTGLDCFNDKITVMQIRVDNRVVLYTELLKDISETKINELKELLENNFVIGHNLKFDLKFLKQQFNITPLNIFDTWVAEILISGGMKARQKGVATLDAVTKERTNVELNKDIKLRTSFKGKDKLSAAQEKYASEDVEVLPSIHKQQMQQLAVMGLNKVFDIEMKCIPATVWLELSGIPINTTGLNKIMLETRSKIETAELNVKTIFKESGYKHLDLFGLPSLNLSSNSQLLKAMQDIGLKVESTGDEVISSIDHPIGKAIKEYRKLNKLLSGFILKFPEHIHKNTNRIQSSFNQCGTNTGRFTSNNPNMQQVPHDKSIRALFQAEEGNKIITADYSQIELRIIAEVSQEPKFLEIYRNNGDLHRLTASLVLDKPIVDITKEERQQAKAINFGFAYGLGAKSFAQKAKNEYDIVMTDEKAQEFRDMFFANYPVLDSYLQSAAREAKQTHQIRNKSGRIIKFENGLEDWQYENYGKNTPIQSLSADITKTAMGKLYHKLKPFNTKFINSVHDELVFEVKTEQVEAVSSIIKTEMESSGSEYLKSIPCLVEVVMGDVWQK